MSKHTPGPWTAEHVKGTCFSLLAGSTQLIAGCGCCQSPWLGGEDIEANARLIQAAPDLLFALQAILSINEQSALTEAAQAAIYGIAAAAVANATGETA